VNLPGTKLRVPAMSDADRDNAIWAAHAGIDFIGLSFVRRPEEVRELKELLDSHGSKARVIAKIEKPEALERLEEIVEATDGVMVARGDLGVEIDIARTAVEQKRIIAICNERHKPVIVATQMLDSHARRSDRRGQRHSRWLRRLHAFAGNRCGRPSGGRRAHDEPHCPGDRAAAMWPKA
jgi:pyruvate kinase